MKHTITITFETNEYASLEAIEAIAEDMKVQLEGLDDYRNDSPIPYRNVVMSVVQSSSLSSPRMGAALREEVCEYLINALSECMFGDGAERDYIADGMEFQGVNNMTDLELLEQLEFCKGEDDDLVIRVRIDLEIDEALNEEE